MAVSRGLRRLLEVRVLEEELRKATLEEALGDLRRLEAVLDGAQERERNGRRQVIASAGSADVADRIAGLEETRSAGRHVAALKPRIAELKVEVAARRAEFLAKRIERRQAETLIRKAEAADAVAAGHRAQRELDDWFLGQAERSDGAVEES